MSPFQWVQRFTSWTPIVDAHTAFHTNVRARAKSLAPHCFQRFSELVWWRNRRVNNCAPSGQLRRFLNVPRTCRVAFATAQWLAALGSAILQLQEHSQYWHVFLKRLKHGYQLFTAHHVYGVWEELARASGLSDVLGNCVAQMKNMDYDCHLDDVRYNKQELVRF